MSSREHEVFKKVTLVEQYMVYTQCLKIDKIILPMPNFEL